MNTSTKTKINRLGRIGKIISILLIVATIIKLILSLPAMLSIVGSASAFSALTAGEYSVLINFLSVLITGAATIVTFIFLMKLANEFQHCDTPFTTNAIRKMTVFAWVLLGIAILSNIASIVLNVVSYSHFQMLNSGSILTLLISKLLSPDFSVLAALALLFLTKIFRYGAELQKESDETL